MWFAWKNVESCSDHRTQPRRNHCFSNLESAPGFPLEAWGWHRRKGASVPTRAVPLWQECQSSEWPRWGETQAHWVLLSNGGYLHSKCTCWRWPGLGPGHSCSWVDFLFLFSFQFLTERSFTFSVGAVCFVRYCFSLVNLGPLLGEGVAGVV